MFCDYQSLVVKEYQRKLAQNEISPLLVHPTPANLRDECLAVCRQRYQKEDEELLKSFFENQHDRAGYLAAIKKYDIDKFKPLRNFLKNQVAKPDERTIELLAWLINFEPRPYDEDTDYDTDNICIEIQSASGAEAVEKTKNGETEQQNTAEEKNKEEKPYKSIEQVREPVKSTITFKKQRIAILAIVIISSLSLGSYWLGNKNSSKPTLTGKEGCMYWTGDHYEQVPCNKKVDGIMVVALDAEKLAHFKRITNTDTITAKSKGWVWYTKIDNVVEFFTSDGYHPIQYERRLRPLTDHIIDRYVQPK